MADFNVRADSVNVEQIMEQIRARIREKRGVDYTEQQIRELAAVKLEKFLDPRGVRSDLLEEFRRMRPASDAPALPNYAFDDSTLFETHRAPIRWIRSLLRPVLKLLFNPNPLIQALHIQSRLNTLYVEGEASRRARDQLTFEVMHNMVVETTRLGIEVKNLKMRVESLASRLDFNERRARALEGAVVYKPSGSDAPASLEVVSPAAVRPLPAPSASPPPPGQTPSGPEGPGQRSRRRRRRRGRRGGAPAVALMGGQGSGQTVAPPPGDEGEPRTAAAGETSGSAAETPPTGDVNTAPRGFAGEPVESGADDSDPEEQ